jgi:hypothetical protein
MPVYTVQAMKHPDPEINRMIYGMKIKPNSPEFNNVLDVRCVDNKVVYFIKNGDVCRCRNIDAYFTKDKIAELINFMAEYGYTLDPTLTRTVYRKGGNNFLFTGP